MSVCNIISSSERSSDYRESEQASWDCLTHTNTFTRCLDASRNSSRHGQLVKQGMHKTQTIRPTSETGKVRHLRQGKPGLQAIWETT